MKLTLAEPRGFCSGVNRAINILEDVVRNEKERAYVYHEIVHNAWVVRDFQRRGVVFVESLDDVPDGALLLFSAHGVSPQIRAEAAARKIRAIDATCPLVHRIHQQVRDYADAGYTLSSSANAGTTKSSERSAKRRTRRRSFRPSTKSHPCPTSRRRSG